jgi:hypothetical protein
MVIPAMSLCRVTFVICMIGNHFPKPGRGGGNRGHRWSNFFLDISYSIFLR